MGFFDLLTIPFGWIDLHLLSWLPPLSRLAVWAAVSAAVTMALYWRLSPQQHVSEIKRKVAEARDRLAQFDGPLDEALPLIKNALRLSARHMWVTLWPAVLASLPVLFVVSWVSGSYGYQTPSAGEAIVVHAEPGHVRLRLETSVGLAFRQGIAPVPWPAPGATASVIDSEDLVIAELPLAAPVPVIDKRRWWHWLFGNPNGYLPRESQVERLEIALSEIHYFGFGPDWMRGWETPFFLVLVVCSLMIKIGFRIQ